MIRSVTVLADHDAHPVRSNGDVGTPTLSPEVSRALAIARWEDDGGRVLDAGAAAIAAAIHEHPHDDASQEYIWRLS